MLVFFILISSFRAQVAPCVRPGPAEDSECVVPCKDVPLGSLNDVPLNFGGPNPNFGGVNRTFKPERQKSQITWKLLSRSWQNSYRGYTPWMRLCRCVHISPGKSKTADGSHPEFREMLVSPQRIPADMCTNTDRKMHHGMRRWSRDKSRNRKLIRVTSSNQRLEHKCVDLSDRYFNQIWSSATLLTCRNMPSPHNLKMAAILNLSLSG